MSKDMTETEKQIRFSEQEVQKRIGIKYPDYFDSLWELPTRMGRNGMQVWNGEKWLPLKVSQEWTTGHVYGRVLLCISLLAKSSTKLVQCCYMQKLTPKQRDEFLDRAAMMAASTSLPKNAFAMKEVAQNCYYLADALLAERDRRTNW